MSEPRTTPPIKTAHAVALAAIAILLAAAAVVMLWLRDPQPARRLTLDTSNGTLSPVAPQTGAQSGLEGRPEVQEYRERQRFEQRIQTFLRQADRLSESERAATARDLEAEIQRREAARELSAGEALLLRMSLLSASDTDEGSRLKRAQALAQQYRTDSERRQAAFEEAQRNDPRFRSYKQREAEIVAEVQAMQSIPGGLDRDTYLRQRLQEAREAAYAQPAPATPAPQAPAPGG